jgi:hypothetical protein
MKTTTLQPMPNAVGADFIRRASGFACAWLTYATKHAIGTRRLGDCST